MHGKSIARKQNQSSIDLTQSFGINLDSSAEKKHCSKLKNSRTCKTSYKEELKSFTELIADIDYNPYDKLDFNDVPEVPDYSNSYSTIVDNINASIVDLKFYIENDSAIKVKNYQSSASTFKKKVTPSNKLINSKKYKHKAVDIIIKDKTINHDELNTESVNTLHMYQQYRKFNKTQSNLDTNQFSSKFFNYSETQMNEHYSGINQLKTFTKHNAKILLESTKENTNNIILNTSNYKECSNKFTTNTSTQCNLTTGKSTKLKCLIF